MMKSSSKVNYSTRASKSIERKMMRDLLLRFSMAHPLQEHTYIGFGAKYFTDFLLFHKHLHINKLISIEGDIGNKIKYEFNKPLKCIDMIYGKSEEIIPSLEIDKNKTIFWLDYDGILKESCLGDIANITSKIDEGSILFLSYNSRPIKDKELEVEYPAIISPKDRINKFLFDSIGENYLPHDLDTRGLKNWELYSKLLRKIVTNCIQKRLDLINRGSEEKIKFKQLININYKDGVEMSTIGFFFYRNEEFLTRLDSTQINSFDFYSCDEIPYEINVPNLTLKEIKSLLEEMPTDKKINRFKGIIKESDIENFKKIYKYMPIYSDTELA